MNKPTVSIITPSYNQSKFIEQTILSVINQSYKNIQYIVIDGGSNDNTMDIVNKYKFNISIIIHEKDKGQSHAINKGLLLAKGELVGWINSDDILYFKCVEKIVSAYLKQPNHSIYYNRNYNIIDDKSRLLRRASRYIPNRNYLLRNNFKVLQPGSFYNMEIVKAVNYLDINDQYCMDLDLWLKISKKEPICCINDSPYAAYRMWAETKTNIGGERFYKNIRKVLLRSGAKIYYPSVLKAYILEIINLFVKRIKIFLF